MFLNLFDVSDLKDMTLGMFCQHEPEGLIVVRFYNETQMRRAVFSLEGIRLLRAAALAADSKFPLVVSTRLETSDLYLVTTSSCRQDGIVQEELCDIETLLQVVKDSGQLSGRNIQVIGSNPGHAYRLINQLKNRITIPDIEEGVKLQVTFPGCNDPTDVYPEMEIKRWYGNNRHLQLQGVAV